MRRFALLVVVPLLPLALASGPAPAARGPGQNVLRLVNCDLGGPEGALAAAKYDLVRSLLVYLQADVAVLHNARLPSVVSSSMSSATHSLARSLGMYSAYSYLDPGSDTRPGAGSALLSRPRLRVPEEQVDVTPGLAYLVVDAYAGASPITVVAVHATSNEATKAAAERVSALVRSAPRGRQVVCASWDPGLSPEAAVAAWSKAGLVDAFAAARSEAAATYPAGSPKQRLTYVFVSPALRPAVLSARVIGDARARKIGDRLPVEVTLRP